MKESLIYGVFGGLIGSLYMGWVCSPKTPCLAVVDIQVLISKKSQQLAKTILSPTRASPTQVSPAYVSSTQVSSIHPSLIREVGDRLKEDLKAFAATHNLILLAKSAVVGGDLPDKTAQILALIEEGEQP